MTELKLAGMTKHRHHISISSSTARQAITVGGVLSVIRMLVN